jgi:hypothetical protein
MTLTNWKLSRAWFYRKAFLIVMLHRAHIAIIRHHLPRLRVIPLTQEVRDEGENGY